METCQVIHKSASCFDVSLCNITFTSRARCHECDPRSDHRASPLVNWETLQGNKSSDGKECRIEDLIISSAERKVSMQQNYQ